MISSPDNWPTHRGEPGFWEELGRAVATFGFLEDIIPRFLLAFEGSKDGRNYTEEDVARWVHSLERSLSDPLGPLIPKIEQAFEGDGRVPAETSVEIVARLKEIKRRRNALCHGSWIGFAEGGGAQLRHFVRNKEGETVSRSEQLSTEDIATVRFETVSLIHRLAEMTVSIGVQLPGSDLPDVSAPAASASAS